jgi:hypothetical protein
MSEGELSGGGFSEGAIAEPMITPGTRGSDESSTPKEFTISELIG